MLTILTIDAGGRSSPIINNSPLTTILSNKKNIFRIILNKNNKRILCGIIYND